MTDDTTPAVLIELGEDHGVVPEPPRGRRVPRGWGRVVRLAVPALAVLLLTAAAADAMPAPLRSVAHVAAGPDDRVVVTGSHAIVAGTRDGHGDISAYALAGGPGWHSPLEVTGDDMDVRVVGGVVIADANLPGTNGVRTEAFDARTGRRLWASPDEMGGPGPAGAVMLSAHASDGGTVWRQVDVRTGATRATVAAAPNCSTQFVVDPDHGVPDGLLEMCFDPTLTGAPSLFDPTLRLVDMLSGATRATRQLHLTVDPSLLRTDNGLPQPQVTIIDGFVVLTHINIPLPMADAFEIADLTPVWSSLPIVDLDALAPCGNALCVDTADGARLLDPRTGAVLPGAVTTDTAVAPTFVLLAIGGAPLSELLRRTPDGTAALVPSSTSGSVWLARDRTPHNAFATNASVPREALIELLDGVGIDACVQLGVYLACATASDEMTFWRLPI